MNPKKMPRIAGIYVNKQGQMSVSWCALNPEADIVHLYACHQHEREVMAVQAESLRARGSYIPVAYNREDADFADRLLTYGCNMLPRDSMTKRELKLAEAYSLEIWERMRTGRFKVARPLQSWRDEYKTFFLGTEGVPMETHPLMAATRLCLEHIDWAKSQSTSDKIKGEIKYPRISIA